MDMLRRLISCRIIIIIITYVIFTGRQKFSAERKKLYCGFVDMEKTFDIVPRELTRWTMCKLGVDLVSAVMSLCHKHQTAQKT